MKEEIIKVLKIEPGKMPRCKKIPNELEALQKAVGGYIEVVPIAEGITLIVNEEGKLQQLPFNRNLIYLCDRRIESIVGTAILVGTDGLEFRSLTDDEVKLYTHQFKHAEVGI